MVTTVVELLQRYQDNLASVARRQFVVEAYKDELDRVTRDKVFRIHNDVIWRLMLDARDVNVMHLGSWARGAYEPGGLFGQLQAHHLNAFPRQRPLLLFDKDDALWRQRRDHEHADQFKSLFSCSCEPFPTVASMIALREKFIGQMAPVVADRDRNRAHPYERGNKGSAKMLDLTETRDALRFAQETLNGLRMIASQSSYNHEDMNEVNPKEVAVDLVDNLLIGTSSHIARIRGATERKAFYEDLHRRHDALGSTLTLFNDRQLVT